MIAEKVADRHGNQFTLDNFDEILSPMFERIRRSDLANPGKSPSSLVEIYKKGLRTGFTIGGGFAG